MIKVNIQSSLHARTCCWFQRSTCDGETTSKTHESRITRFSVMLDTFVGRVREESVLDTTREKAEVTAVKRYDKARFSTAQASQQLKKRLGA